MVFFDKKPQIKKGDTLKPVKTGIIGCGMISDIYLKNCCENFRITDVIACADQDMRKAREKAEKYTITACTVDELLSNNEIEAVINLTIPTAHAAISKQILLAGKHAYSEKPLAVELADGEELIAIAEKAGLCIGAAPDTFLGGGIQTARKLIDDGWIGDPVGVNAFLMTKGPEAFHPNPDFFYQYGGGPLLDFGPYYITAMVALLGPVNRVSAFSKITYPQRTITGNNPRKGEKIKVEVPTHFATILEFASGVTGTMTVSFDVQYPYWESKLPYIQIEGSGGSIIIPDPNKFEGPVKLRRLNGEYHEVPLSHGFTGNMRGMGFAYMLNNKANRKDCMVNGNLALHVLDVMTGISQSAETGNANRIKNPCGKPETLPLVMPEYLY
jgi:predicted dehydrogenase